MQLKKHIILCIAIALSFNAFSQKKQGGPLYIVYVDNSLPSGDGLSGAMLSDIVSFIDTVKEGKFLFFLSNGKKFQTTESARTVTDLVNGLTGKYANAQFPDQNEDVLALRRKLLETIKDYNGEVRMVLYVTNKFVAGLQDKYSPLVGLFPKEIAHLYSTGIKKVSVLINYPAMENSRVVESEVLQILNFNTNDTRDPLVSYTLNTKY